MDSLRTTSQAVIFDLDGTLLDTAADLAAAVNYALAAFGFPRRTQAEVVSMVGQGVHVLIERATPAEAPREVKARVLAAFRTYYAEHLGDKTSEFSGVSDLLQRLKNKQYKLAVVSNKPHEAVKILVDDYFPNTFEVIVGQSEDAPRKPDPTTTLAALSTLHVLSKDAVYVGDSEVDVKTAQAANVASVLVDWGFRTREQLQKAGATCIVSSAQEVMRAIEAQRAAHA